jgi:spermidine/putrescine transport system permease protein
MKNKTKLLYLAYAWLIVFGLLPLCLIAIASFLSETREELITLPLTLSHYKALMSPLVGHIMFRSILVGLATTILCLVIAYPFSYFMVKSRHQSILLLLIIIPFWTSSLIRTYALIAILKYHGVLNTWLLKTHLITEPLTLLYTNSAVIIGLAYTLFPFMVLPLFTQMERFDFRLLDAARDLGAHQFALFFRVFLPNTIRGITSGSILVFLPAMTLFYIPNILGGARSILLGNLIQNQFFVAENWPQGAATSVLLTTLLIGVFLISRRSQKVMV